MIKADENQLPISMLCCMVSVSRNGYYAWRQRLLSDNKQANQWLTGEIKYVLEDEKDGLAHPESLSDSKHKVYRLVGIVWPELCGTLAGEQKRPKNTKAITNSHHSLPVASNLLKQDFTVDAPLSKMGIGHNRYLDRRRLLYLAVVLELYSRRAIGLQSPNACDRIAGV